MKRKLTGFNTARFELSIGIASGKFLDDFSTRNEFSDVVLVVEKKKLYLNKNMAARAHPFPSNHVHVRSLNSIPALYQPGTILDKEVIEFEIENISELTASGQKGEIVKLHGIEWQLEVRKEVDRDTEKNRLKFRVLTLKKEKKRKEWSMDVNLKIAIPYEIDNCEDEKFEMRVIVEEQFDVAKFPHHLELEHFIAKRKKAFKTFESVRFILTVEIVRETGLDDFSAKSELTDVTFIVDGERVHVNKKILSLHSPVFRAMLVGGFKEANQTEIPLEEVGYSEFVEFLNFIYKITDYVNYKNIHHLLKLMDRFDVYMVRTICENYLRFTNELPEYEKFELSEMYRLPLVKTQIMRKIACSPTLPVRLKLNSMEESTKDEIARTYFLQLNGKGYTDLERTPLECGSIDYYNEICDVRIFIKNKSVDANKEILSLHSPVFHSYFFENSKMKEIDELHLDNLDYDEFTAFLSFFYNSDAMQEDSLLLDAKRVICLMNLALGFQTNFLIMKFETRLMYSSSSEMTMKDKIVLVDRYSLNRLKWFCLAEMWCGQFKELEEVFFSLSSKMKTDILRRIEEVRRKSFQGGPSVPRIHDTGFPPPHGMPINMNAPLPYIHPHNLQRHQQMQYQ